MKRIFWIVITGLMAGAACAATAPAFNERVEHARQLEGQPVPNTYLHQKFVPVANTLLKSRQMQGCTKAPDASKERFTMVFDVTREGKVADIDYQPRTNTAQCLAAVWAAAKLPPPPAGIEGGMSIYINWSFSEEQPSK